MKTPAPMLGPLDRPAVAKMGGITLGRGDVRNLCLLLVGFAAVLILIPPVRAYPMSDDWIYAQSVKRLLDLNYRPHDQALAISLGHLVWGALLSVVFGYSFVTLTAATLLMSATCLTVFYLLLRQLRVASQPALLGTALLGFNPMYVYLSYSFMTDVAFMLYVLAACMFYAGATQGRGNGWLLLGSVATAFAYLTRQSGIVLVPAVVFFLWWSRQLSWYRALLASAFPLATAAVYGLWQRGQPEPLVSQLVVQVMNSAFADPAGRLWLQLRRLVLVLQLPGLCLLPLVCYFRSRHPLFAMPIFIVMFFFQFETIQEFGTVFPAFGSLVDHTGLLMYDYAKQRLWSEQFWTLLGIVGALSVSLFLANWLQIIWTRFTVRNARPRPTDADPGILIYTAGIVLAAVTSASPFLYDRHLLPTLPMLMLYPLRRMSVQTVENVKARAQLNLAWLLLAPIALFSLLAMRDFQVHAKARWDAAGRLVAAGAKHEQINAGFEWMGWHLFDAGVDRVRQTREPKYISAPYYAVLDPIYLVSDLPREGYAEIDSVPYTSWLSGRQVCKLLVLQRK